MNRTLLRAGAALSLALAAGGALAQAPPAPPPAPAPQAPMVIKPVKAGVYMVVGNGGNSTVRIGQDGVIVVDAKNPGAAIYAELMDRIKSVTPLPVTEVIVTHHHSDHSGNTVYFESNGVTVIGHQGEMAALQTYSPPGNVQRPVGPSVVYDSVLTAGIPGAPAMVHHYASGHTAGDSVVYFPDVKIVCGGDEVVAVTPNIDYAFGGSLSGWLASLDAISKLDFDYIIPGHGADPLSKADFMAYRQKWMTLAERGRAAIKAGTPKAQLLAALKAEDLGWNLNTPAWQQPARLDAFYADLSKP